MAAMQTTEDRIVVVNTDCPPAFLEQVKTEALFASMKFNMHKEMTESQKRKFDTDDGSAWNVIVGHNFGANVRHISECFCSVMFCYLDIDQLEFLIFKAQ
jgi:hypothetical protein